jgi:hypothetical protein
LGCLLELPEPTPALLLLPLPPTCIPHRSLALLGPWLLLLWTRVLVLLGRAPLVVGRAPLVVVSRLLLRCLVWGVAPLGGVGVRLRLVATLA